MYTAVVNLKRRFIVLIKSKVLTLACMAIFLTACDGESRPGRVDTTVSAQNSSSISNLASPQVNEDISEGVTQNSQSSVSQQQDVEAGVVVSGPGNASGSVSVEEVESTTTIIVVQSSSQSSSVMAQSSNVDKDESEVDVPVSEELADQDSQHESPAKDDAIEEPEDESLAEEQSIKEQSIKEQAVEESAEDATPASVSNERPAVRIALSLEVVSSVDSSEKTFKVYGSPLVTYNYSKTAFFNGELNVGDVVELLASNDTNEIAVVGLGLANDREVTYQASGILRVSSFTNGEAFFALNDSDVEFKLEPTAEYGATTFTEFNQNITDQLEASGAFDTNVNALPSLEKNIFVSSVHITYAKDEGFTLNRLVLRTVSLEGKIENIAIIDDTLNEFNAQRAIITMQGENYIVENLTEFAHGFFLTRDEALKLEDLKVGSYINMTYWHRNLQDFVATSVRTECEFGIDQDASLFVCATQ